MKWVLISSRFRVYLVFRIKGWDDFHSTQNVTEKIQKLESSIEQTCFWEPIAVFFFAIQEFTLRLLPQARSFFSSMREAGFMRNGE